MSICDDSKLKEGILGMPEQGQTIEQDALDAFREEHDRTLMEKVRALEEVFERERARQLDNKESWEKLVPPANDFSKVALSKINFIIASFRRSPGGVRISKIGFNKVEIECPNKYIACVDNFGRVMWRHNEK